MATLIKFKNVSLFKEEPYGIKELSFEIERGRTYRIITQSAEQLNTLAGLIEGRFRKESGHIEKSDNLFVQSDRLLLGDKVYSQTVSQWLYLTSEFFQFGNKRRSKFGIIQALKARHILDYPIYKLRAIDKIKFALLALAFQEKGIILINKLLSMELDESLCQFLVRIIKETHTTCCLLLSPEVNTDLLELDSDGLINIEL